MKLGIIRSRTETEMNLEMMTVPQYTLIPAVAAILTAGLTF